MENTIGLTIITFRNIGERLCLLNNRPKLSIITKKATANQQDRVKLIYKSQISINNTHSTNNFNILFSYDTNRYDAATILVDSHIPAKLVLL